MGSLSGVYEGRIVSLGNGNATAFIPQVFGDVNVTISDFVHTPEVGMGWVAFLSGNCEYPVWLSGAGGSGGGGSDGFSFIQDTFPVPKKAGQTWFDTSDTTGGTAWTAIDEGTGELVWVQFAPGPTGVQGPPGPTGSAGTPGTPGAGIQESKDQGQLEAPEPLEILGRKDRRVMLVSRVRRGSEFLEVARQVRC